MNKLTFRIGFAALVGVCALVGHVTPAGTQEPDAPPRLAEPDGGIVEVLDARGRAYMSRDRELFASTITGDPFTSEELARFDNSSALRFGTYTERVETRYSGDIASERVRSRYSEPVVAFHIVIETAMDGVETVPFVEDAFYTFVNVGGGPYGGWRVRSANDFAPIGVFPPAQLWDTAPVATAESEHFLAIAHADGIDAVRAFLPEAESAYDDVKAFWPREVSSRYVLIVPPSTEELGRLFRATVDLTKFVAFAAGSVDRTGGWAPAGVRMFINPPNFSRYEAEGRRSIFAHELIHAVTRLPSGPFVPSWVEEGLANAGSETEDPLRRARGGSSPDGFPADEEFYVGPTGDIVRVYRRSQVAIDLLIERGGVDALATFYESLGSARVAAGTSDYHVRRAAADVGYPYEEWVADYEQRVG